jgi:hypothetical protein
MGWSELRSKKSCGVLHVLNTIVIVSIIHFFSVIWGIVNLYDK